MVQIHLLGDLVVLFAAALVVVVVLHRLRLPTIAGFLVAGAVIGPSGLGWIANVHDIEQLAEIGVVLLLFTIGLEFSVKELRRLGRVLVVGGGLQVTLTTAAVAGIAHALGVEPGRGVFYGFLVALSSTAIVLKGLAERGETDAPHGRLIVGVLLFQDLCVVPMMLLVPMLGGQGGGIAGIVRALLTAAAVVVATLALARLIVPRALHLVAATRARDVFVLAIVVVCAGVAWLTSLVGLSLALGAFLAGIALADSEYGHQAFADVLPLREIFTSLFFVSMGMLLDVRALAEAPGTVLAIVVALLVGKALIATLAGLVLRFPLRMAVLAGLSLAQVGEFSFVLARLGEPHGLLAPAGMRLFIAASVVTMLVTPFALRFGPRVAAGVARLGVVDRLLGPGREALTSVPEGLSGHVVVLGYGVGGRMLAEVLRGAGIPFVVVEINAESVREARRQGEPVHYGDVTSPDILAHARVSEARQVAVLLNDPGATLRAVRAVRRLAPDVAIVARVRYVTDVPALLQAGATEAVAQEFEASLEVIERVMKGGSAAATLPGRLPAGLEVESLAVHDGDWIAGRSLQDARLRPRTGATVVSVTRGETTTVNPSPEGRMAPGDVLCLLGDDDQVARARALAARGPEAEA
jgi:CPA2 family monovalent cation:H+ antiporter-2